MRLMRLFFCAIVLSLLLAACEDSVNPILESDRQFTLFGTLDMDQDTQYVRVIPIRPMLESDTNAPFNVSFISTDRVTGETIVWRDSTVQFANGITGHVFYAPLRVQPGHTYRIEIQSTDSDLVTSVETTVPAEPEVVVMPEVVSSVTTPSGALVRARQLIRWEGIADEPFSIEQWYRFFSIADFSFRDVQLPYVPINGLAEGSVDVWEMDLDLKRDRDTLETIIDLNASTSLAGLGDGQQQRRADADGARRVAVGEWPDPVGVGQLGDDQALDARSGVEGGGGEGDHHHRDERAPLLVGNPEGTDEGGAAAHEGVELRGETRCGAPARVVSMPLGGAGEPGGGRQHREHAEHALAQHAAVADGTSVGHAGHLLRRSPRSHEPVEA